MDDIIWLYIILGLVLFVVVVAIATRAFRAFKGPADQSSNTDFINNLKRRLTMKDGVTYFRPTEIDLSETKSTLDPLTTDYRAEPSKNQNVGLKPVSPFMQNYMR